MHRSGKIFRQAQSVLNFCENSVYFNNPFLRCKSYNSKQIYETQWSLIGAGSLGVHKNNLDIFLKSVSLRLIPHLNYSICKYVCLMDLFGVLFPCDSVWGLEKCGVVSSAEMENVAGFILLPHISCVAHRKRGNFTSCLWCVWELSVLLETRVMDDIVYYIHQSNNHFGH
jgi:hypothetical protein